MDVFDLAARLTLDSSEYDKGLEKAQGSASGWGSKLSTAAKGAAIGVAAVTTAVTAVATTVVNSTKALAEHGDEIDKNSQKMGLSATSYQEWDYVLQHAGTSMANMGTGLKTLTNKIDDAKNGSTDAQAMFEKLGISMEELSTMSREDIFSATIAGFQGMSDSTERAALANDLFGKSGQELTPLFNATTEETSALIQQVNDLGGVLSETAVKDAAAFEDSLLEMQTAFSGAKNAMLTNFMPALTKVMNGVTQFIGGNDKGLEGVNKGIEEFVQNLAKAAPKAMNAGAKILEGLATSIINNLPMLMETGTQILLDLVKFIIAALPNVLQSGVQIISTLAQGIAQALPDLIPAAIDAILTMVETLIDNADMLIDGAIALIIGLAEGLINAIPKLIEKAPEIVVKLTTAIIRNAPKILEAAIQLIVMIGKGLIDAIPKLAKVPGQIITALGDWIKEEAPKIGAKAGEIITKIKEKLTEGIAKIKDVGKNLIEGLWNGISDKVTWITDKIKSFGESVISSIKGIFGIHSPSKVFAQIGGYLAEGLGVGWDKEAKSIIDDINGDLQFSASASVKTADRSENQLNFDELESTIASAVSEALEGYKINWDNRNLGRLVKSYA